LVELPFGDGSKKVVSIKMEEIDGGPESGLDDRYVISSSIDCEIDVLVAVMDVPMGVSPR